MLSFLKYLIMDLRLKSKKNGQYDKIMKIREEKKCTASWQNQQNGMCAQQRLRSAWAFTQSDQSLHCPLEES